MELPVEGYVSLPLRLNGGRLVTCDLDESVRKFLQLNLNVPEQGTHRPAWMCADPEMGCRVPHYDYQVVSQTLGSDTSTLVAAIRRTARAVEPRIADVSVKVSDVVRGDPARRRPDGSVFKGQMKRVTIRCERVDGKTQELHYDVAFGGSGPVFDNEEQ